MKIFEVSPQMVTDFFLNNKETAEMGLPDEELKYLKINKKYYMTSSSMFLGLGEEEGNITLLIRWEYFTPITLILHTYLKSELHGEHVELKKCMDFFFDYLRETTHVRKLQAMIAEPCINVVKATERFNFKKEGFVENCLIWRGELKGLHIYGLDLRGD